MKKQIVALFAILLLSSIAYASDIVITEIMFNPDGGDSGREWIELFNNGDSEIDVTSLIVYEGGVNHGVSLDTGSSTIPVGGYAVLAYTPSGFKGDYPGFSGNLFSTVYKNGLLNSGEYIAVKDMDGNVIDEVDYDPQAAGAVNCLSLGSIDSDNSQMSSWSSCAAGGTPGEGDYPVPVKDEPGDDKEPCPQVPEFSAFAVVVSAGCIMALVCWKRKQTF